MALFAFAFLLLLVSLPARHVACNPLPDPDKTLIMYLKIEPGSETAVPMEGGAVKFQCDIQDYRESSHVVTWTRFDSKSASWIVLAEAGTLKAPADQRILVSRVQAANASRRGNVHQRLVIDPVRASDVGLYRCNVQTSIDNDTLCITKTIASRELALTVHSPEIFPVCTPSASSKDPLVPGDILSCGTLTDTRIPVVTRRGNRGGNLEGWGKGRRRDGRPGWELTREVNATDDGAMYDCWSFSTDFAGAELALSCPIAPRVVGGTKAPASQGLSVGAIVGIAAGALLAVFVILVICMCCCCCNKSTRA